MTQPKILIVDDDPLELSLFVKFCEGQAWDVVPAKDGKAGFKILSQEKIDLAIVDLCMPEMDGLTFLKHTKRENIRIPIVIMSGYGSLKDGQNAVKYGAVDVLDKPFTQVDLHQSIQAYLAHNISWSTRLESFLRDHCHNPKLKFEDLMCHFHFSKSYGSELFNKHLGKTFRIYLRKIRLEKAEAMMNSKLTLSEIAQSCGFASLANFSKVFKLEYQCNPTDYRKKMNIRTNLRR